MSVALLFFLLFLHAVDVQARDRGVCIEAAAGGGSDAAFDPDKELAPLTGRHQKLANAARLRAAGKFDKADKEYEAAEKALTDPELKLRVAYLRAGLSAEAGRLREAADRYLALAGRYVLLADWCLYRAGNALFELGEFEESAGAFARVSGSFPRHSAARGMRCRAISRLGSPAATVVCVDSLSGPEADLLLLQARAALDAG
ncbi:MAG: hypothetical protein FJ109_12745, partial [Deltaproteobacteria bacterium]|nr:hypothetical protein [Deltaproteobacteria bacterium]